MNNFNIPQSDGERLGAKGALLDLIARKAPLLMKIGGGNISQIKETVPKKTTLEERNFFIKRLQELRALGYADFKARQKISEETGYSYQTIWNHTGGKKHKINLPSK